MINKLRDLIVRINETMRFYEIDYVELKRWIGGEREPCESFEHYIESRFNMELSKLPEFAEMESLTQGHLFLVDSITKKDSYRKKFGTVTLRLLEPEDMEIQYKPILEGIEKTRVILGGKRITFNCVLKRVKVIIDP